MEAKFDEFWEKVKSFGERFFIELEKQTDHSAEKNVPICYFIKQQNTAYSIRSLLERQFIQDAQILLRSQVENLVYLVASIEEENFKNLFESQNLLRRSKTTKSLIKYTTNSGGKVKKELEKTRQDIQAEIEQLKEKGLNIEQLAKKYSLLNEYFLIYECCNAETHSLPSAIIQHYDKNNSRFIHYPGLDEFDATCVGMLLCYLRSIDFLQSHFDMSGFGDELENINKEFLDIYKE